MWTVTMGCLYPTLESIETLSKEESLLNIGATHVTDFSGTCLIPRSFFIGRMLTAIRSPLEYCGVITVDGGQKKILHTIQVALERFREFLLNPMENPEPFIETFLSVSYNNRWPNQFARAYHLFHPEEAFPSMDKALCFFAPKLLQQIAASKIPFDTLGRLLLDQQLTSINQRDIQQWIEDVNFFGKVISQKLLFSFMSNIVCRNFPGLQPHEKLSSTFYLAWRVHHLGLHALVDDHPPLIQPESEFLVTLEQCTSIRLGNRLPLEFPLDCAVSAYDIQGHSDAMLLCSPSPLSLGIWAYETIKKRSCLPYLKILYMDEYGRFFITERIEGLLDSPDIWENPGIASKKNVKLCRALAHAVTILCQYNAAFDLPLEHLFLSEQGKIGILRACDMQFSHFHMPTIEKFIRSVCRKDQERILFVEHEGNLFKHPVCVALRDLIQQHCFQATEHLIRERMHRVIDEEEMREMFSWHSRVQNKIRLSLASLQKYPYFASKKPLENLRLLAEAFCALQMEFGFVMHMPQDISSMLVTWVVQRYGIKKKVV